MMDRKSMSDRIRVWTCTKCGNRRIELASEDRPDCCDDALQVGGPAATRKYAVQLFIEAPTS
jgi:hypothetical protein